MKIKRIGEPTEWMKFVEIQSVYDDTHIHITHYRLPSGLAHTKVYLTTLDRSIYFDGHITFPSLYDVIPQLTSQEIEDLFRSFYEGGVKAGRESMQCAMRHLLHSPIDEINFKGMFNNED